MSELTEILEMQARIPNLEDITFEPIDGLVVKELCLWHIVYT